VAHGARIRTCCEAVRLEDRGARGWEVAYRQHLPAKPGHPPHLLDPSDRPDRVVRARQVVLAAGTLGTTRLLLANRAGVPPLSPRLGSGFSSNGDVLVFVRDADRWLDPSTGPTITASIRARDPASPSGRGFFLQDAGAPTASEWLWQTAEALPDAWRLGRTLRRRLGARLRGRRDASLSPVLAEAMGTARTSAAMVPLLGMGRDVPDGRLTLHGERLALSWRERPSRAFFEGLEAGAEGLARALGGRLWRPGGRFARLISVHPLGGCPMGDERSGGVVDEYGRVRGARGLYIADGSIMPGPVGANPSLTIAALADRIAERALAE
jgi:cholesterol oxidase